MSRSLQDNNLQDSQEVALYVLTMISALLSVLGSLTIVHKVVAMYFFSGPYDRLLLGLSLCDIIASISYAITPFMLPKDTSDRAWASGSDGTCSALGFLTQFSYSTLVYNGMLSFYYLLTVRYGIKRKEFTRKYERWMHLSVVIFFLGTATLGVSIGLYSEIDLGPGCWIRDYPRGCYEEGGCTGHFYGWVFTALPGLASLVTVTVNNLVIFCYVRRELAPRSDEMETSPDVQHRKQHIREVAIQGWMYVGSFLLCFICHLAIRVLESSNFEADKQEANAFVLLLFDAFLRPLQGFVNMLIYTRPSYIRLRAAFPDKSTGWAIREALTKIDIPRLSATSSAGTQKVARVPVMEANNPHTPIEPNDDNSNAFPSSAIVPLELPAINVLHASNKEDRQIHTESVVTA
eukprot:Nitzschia sp. Nitz4//scaffold301_size22573//18072//19286//NITZ4_008556-RA/size22573-processed-gene-0.25-mRNA-1//-1//CDS//3329547022//998//frame0